MQYLHINLKVDTPCTFVVTLPALNVTIYQFFSLALFVFRFRAAVNCNAFGGVHTRNIAVACILQQKKCTHIQKKLVARLFTFAFDSLVFGWRNLRFPHFNCILFSQIYFILF